MVNSCGVKAKTDYNFISKVAGKNIEEIRAINISLMSDMNS